MKLLNSEHAQVTYFNYNTREGSFRLTDGDRPLPVLDLTLCIDGEMRYSHNGNTIVLHSGDGILMRPGSFRERYESGVASRYASINVRFDEEPELDFEGYLPNVVNSSILYMLDMMRKDFVTVSSKKNEKLLSAFSYIYNQIAETMCNTENLHIKSIKQYISDNLSNDLTLSKIAEHVHLAPQYVCTLFKKETGTTITGFILKTRIDYAKTLITATSDSILKIAESCGFSDYCYFSHTFKKMTGVSARQFRSNFLK